MRGEKLLSPTLVGQVMTGYHKLAHEQAMRQTGLTTEELQVLAALAEGAGNKEIAEQFYWSEATVKRRVQDVLVKLGVTSRAQAIAEAARRGWV
jgi:DNA-binding NarL/FixJ family response regulator